MSLYWCPICGAAGFFVRDELCWECEVMLSEFPAQVDIAGLARRIAVTGKGFSIADTLSREGHEDYQESRFYDAEDKWRRAMLFYLRAIGLADNRPLAHCVHNVGMALLKCGLPQDAVEVLEQAVTCKSATFGPVSDQVADSFDGLAQALVACGRYDESHAYYRHALDIYTDPVDRARVTVNVGVAFSGQEKDELATECLLAALSMYGEGPDDDGLAAAAVRQKLAIVLCARGLIAEAVDNAETALAVRRSVLGTSHPLTQATQRLIEDIHTIAGTSGDTNEAHSTE